jgi:hypothetical protein
MSGKTGSPAEPRELLGRLVRQAWLKWAREQPEQKPSWLVPWEELDDGQREVDMRIGDALFDAGVQSERARLFNERSNWLTDAAPSTQHDADDVASVSTGLTPVDEARDG